MVVKKKEGCLVIFFLQFRRNSNLILLFFFALGFDVSGLRCCLSSQLAAVDPFQDTMANESQPAAVGRMEEGWHVLGMAVWGVPGTCPSLSLGTALCCLAFMPLLFGPFTL